MNDETTYPSPAVEAYVKHHGGMTGGESSLKHPSEYDGELPAELEHVYYYSMGWGHCVLALCAHDQAEFEADVHRGRIHKHFLPVPIASIRRGYDMAYGFPVAHVLEYSDETGYTNEYRDSDIEL